MYIAKLLNGTLINTGSFLAKGENDIIYFARRQFYKINENKFLDLENNIQSKFAVIIDEEGNDNWEGTTFRTIQYISSNKENCIKFRNYKIREEKLSLNRMNLIEKQIQFLHSNPSHLLANEVKKDIEILEVELNLIDKELKTLEDSK